MGRFLVIYHGAADGAQAELPEDEQAGFLQAWASWAQAHEGALVDPGAPLFRKWMVTVDGVRDHTDGATGYCILQADSHDDAVRIVSEHPHLRLFPGNSIAVLECPPPPA